MTPQGNSKNLNFQSHINLNLLFLGFWGFGVLGFWQACQEHGGYEEITNKKQWGNIGRKLIDNSATITDLNARMKRHYGILYNFHKTK